MRRGEAGVALVSVLALLAIAAALVHLMLGPGEASVARSQRFSEAGQALALARAGEQSAIAVLRRDMVEAPEVDHSGEPWAAIGQAEIDIAGGSFELAISDAQDRVNLNALDMAEPEDLRILLALGAAAGLTQDAAAAIAGALETAAPLRGLDELAARAGLAPDRIEALGRVAAALPGGGGVNLNSAPVAVIAAILRDPARAGALVSLRERIGSLGAEDVSGLGFELPEALDVRSDLYRVETRIRIGGTRLAAESLLQRRSGENGPEVAVVSRRSAAAPPADLP